MTRGRCRPDGARHPNRRWPIALAALASALACVWFAFAEPPVRVVYNASDSVPGGWYRIVPTESVAVGDLVLVHLPAEAASLAARRGYLPAGVPLLKSIAAGPRQRVCAIGSRMRVDGRVVAHARTRDRAGRAMPRWSGCRVLGEDEVLLLAVDHADSFDGRYFGPVPLDSIVGKAQPLWLDEQPEAGTSRKRRWRKGERAEGKIKGGGTSDAWSQSARGVGAARLRAKRCLDRGQRRAATDTPECNHALPR